MLRKESQDMQLMKIIKFLFEKMLYDNVQFILLLAKFLKKSDKYF